MKKTVVAAVAVAGLLFTPPPASAQVCAAFLIGKALIVNATENRELTEKEAMTCGLLVDEKERKAMLDKKKKIAHKPEKH